ncbi:malto-oligosyltrehalose trehalohydrolase [Marinilabiliaceae bacterium ANBcel2]|nr:malto-oligosyltrehalose trehalohydrolase [Marinilabiliaceae bacterium ANBcel2]
MKESVLDISPGLRLDNNKLLNALVWSPFADMIEIVFKNGDKHDLSKTSYGFWYGEKLNYRDNYYKVRVDGKREFPDPASLCQDNGVHGFSKIIDINQFQWSDHNWQGIDQKDLIIYELHVGTFSDGGTFEGVIEKLDHIVSLGINAIEIMPVASFPGHYNWGYDGVYPYSVHSIYGGANKLQKLVDECHNRGVAVILDVVYNHLGPEGNYLREFGPYFTDKYKTPWGDAINFDDSWCDGVRHFFIHNALTWMRDFHIDGLRLDAVHAITDFGAHHFLALLKERVMELSYEKDFPYFLIAECDLNDTKYIKSFAEGGYNMNAQWCDEFHHSLHSLVTGEKQGYYSDFGSADHLIKSFNSGYVYDGIYSPYRKKIFGSKTDDIPREKFVVFSQNHDQIGNRADGKRLSMLVDFEALKLCAGATILSPFTPLLFMGEEYAEESPFYYFTDHSDQQLIEAVREGRKKEFKSFIGSAQFVDPQHRETFLSSCLTSLSHLSEKQKTMMRFYKSLISFRKERASIYDINTDSIQIDNYFKSFFIFTCYSDSENLYHLFNFGDKIFEGNLHKDHSIERRVVIDSSNIEWGGSGGFKLEKSGNFKISAQSFVVLR